MEDEISKNDPQEIRALLKQSFTVQEIKEFCHDRKEFRCLCSDINWEITTKSDAIHHILEHAVQKNYLNLIHRWIIENQPKPDQSEKIVEKERIPNSIEGTNGISKQDSTSKPFIAGIFLIISFAIIGYLSKNALFYTLERYPHDYSRMFIYMGFVIINLGKPPALPGDSP